MRPCPVCARLYEPFPDPYGRPLCRDIFNPITLSPQGETVSFRLDIIYSMPAWGVNLGFERA